MGAALAGAGLVDGVNVWHGIDAWPDPSEVVATLGNFDGVHLGHRAVLRGVVRRARQRGLRSLLISFSPHPLEVLAPERRPRMLQTRGQKIDALARTGLTDLLLVEFTERVAALDGAAFFERVLGDGLRLSEVHVGRGFRFGRGRAGNVELLAEIGRRLGFELREVPPLLVDGEPASSSAIRRALDAGAVARARAMLGRPYAITGEVVHGDGRGRELYCPTANVEVENELVPQRGVYITETVVTASRLPSVTNVGMRPTFGGDPLTVETHVLDFEDDLYHERIEVRFLERLRDEMRFDGIGELADQLARDRAAAEAYFHNQNLSVG